MTVLKCTPLFPAKIQKNGLLKSSQATHQLTSKCEVTSDNTLQNCLHLCMNCQKQEISGKSEGTIITTWLGVCPVHSRGFEWMRKHSVHWKIYWIYSYPHLSKLIVTEPCIWQKHEFLHFCKLASEWYVLRWDKTHSFLILSGIRNK